MSTYLYMSRHFDDEDYTPTRKLNKLGVPVKQYNDAGDDLNEAEAVDILLTLALDYTCDEQVGLFVINGEKVDLVCQTSGSIEC